MLTGLEDIHWALGNRCREDVTKNVFYGVNGDYLVFTGYERMLVLDSFLKEIHLQDL